MVRCPQVMSGSAGPHKPFAALPIAAANSLIGVFMKSKRTIAAVERLESLAANSLEQLIEDTEGKAQVKVKEVEVALIPDAHGASPAVFVTVTVTS